MPISSSVLLSRGMKRQPSRQKVLKYLNLQHNSLLFSTLSVLKQQLHLKELKQNLTMDRQDTSVPFMNVLSS